MRVLLLLTVSLGFALASGCSMCAPGFMDDYATVGGKWQRGNPTQGRVGSIFSDAGTTIAAGANSARVVDSRPAGIEGEVFGEAYTDQYPGADQEFYELNENSSGGLDGPEFDPDLLESEDVQSDDEILMLDNQW
ncbi:MAG: hypothetical protein ABI557_12600 [Aureliella sp.]